uniref:Uncharacterized protein n=1 Tax=Xiphophorus couchianus TaxID=32473 RepID=A0A3B5LFD8_9TELE
MEMQPSTPIKHVPPARLLRLSLSRLYEEHVLATGSLDERIFTGEGANENIGTPGPCFCDGMESQDSATYRLSTNLTASALKVSTPLTGRKYIQEVRMSSPLSYAMKSVGRLHTLLSGTKHGPSAKLTETLRGCARDPSDVISQRLKEMFDVYSQHYEDSELAVKYFHLAEALYYKILESIIEREKMILGDADLSCILEQDIFHRSLLACCLEIVTFSYRPPGDFPNVISIFQLPAYHFYKVIEVLVRSEQGLFREVVKHLNQVEEQVLESLAWTSDSPLWQSLRSAKVPSCQEVMPPQYLEQSEETNNGSIPLTPVKSGPDLRANSIVKGVSPSPTSLQDRYSSPPTGGFRRRLFVDPVEGEPSVTSTGSSALTSPPQTPIPKTGPSSIVTTIPAGQTVFTVTTNNGQTMTIPLQGIANESGSITLIPVQMGGATLQPLSAQTLTGTLTIQSPVTKPAAKAASSSLRKGSLSLFFRKVYHMASVRLRDLCAKLDISSELRRRIWTCFEYSVVHCTDMMKDRHVDQLLMCAVYVMAKVTKEDRSFQNIMKCYRTQPQASSNVRSHALSQDSILRFGSRPNSEDNNLPLHRLTSMWFSSPVPIHSSSTLSAPQPDSAASTPTSASDRNFPSSVGEDERGDLILFYNNVYIKHMRSFALRYSPSSPSTPPLCPYPTLRTGSPRRMLLSSKHSIYISPHRTGSSPLPTHRDRISYYICTSPPNRLQEINSMIRTGETPSRKRSIPLEEEASPKRVCPDSHTTLLRRLQDIANDRSSSH